MFYGTSVSGVILEKAEVDDETEGVMVDTDLLEQLQQVEHQFWRDIWLSLLFYGQISFERNNTIHLQPNNYPANLNNRMKPFEQMSTTLARQKGWQWRGDSYLSLYCFECFDFATACKLAIKHINCRFGDFYMDFSAPPPQENENNESLTALWDRLFPYEFDKFPKGKYTRWVYLMQNGNDFIALIESTGPFYLYEYSTS